MEDIELTKLHPNYVHVARIHSVLAVLPFIIGSIVLEIVGVLPTGLVFAPFAILAILVIVLIPMRRYRSRGFHMADDRLRVVQGVLFHSDTVVPFNRVQHLDVEQGPIERAFGIARLILHTAGTHGASVVLPGLGHEDAVALRETIREHVKRETL